MSRGIAVVHYNRPDSCERVLEGVLDTAPSNARLVICDDGSSRLPGRNLDKFILIRGPNKGVAANKNRALWALQDCHYIAIIEDDLVPTEKGWFEEYEEVAALTDNHHFCRVQDKEVPDTVSGFQEYLAEKGHIPVFGSSPRGDFTFITSKVIHRVGAFNPRFKGAGYAHGEWSERVARASLIAHPLRWWDLRAARDKFTQDGDTTGGRWDINKSEIQSQISTNKRVYRELRESEYIYHPLLLE